MQALDLTADQFAELAQRRLRPEPPQLGDLIARPRGDHDDQPHPIRPPDEKVAIPAAVLIGVVPRPEGPTVLLTQRAATLRSHSAQVAFPGGRVDAVDGSPVVSQVVDADSDIRVGGHRVSLGELRPQAWCT